MRYVYQTPMTAPSVHTNRMSYPPVDGQLYSGLRSPPMTCGFS